MTRAELGDLTARVKRLQRIVKAIQSFDDCRYGSDVARAERELQDALENKTEIPLTETENAA